MSVEPLKKLKSSHIRVSRIKEVIDFYSDFHDHIDIVFNYYDSYKENLDRNRHHFQEDFTKYVTSCKNNQNDLEINLLYALERIDEKCALLK